MYQYHLTNLIFNDGTSVTPGALTVIVGPNNSGKSRCLKDILQIVTATGAHNIVVQEVSWSPPKNIQELSQAYNVKRHLHEKGSWSHRYISPDLSGQIAVSGGRGEWPRAYQYQYEHSGPSTQSGFAKDFGSQLVAYLTTDQRLKLVQECKSLSEEEEYANLMQLFYKAGKDDELRVRKIVSKAFQKEVALDFSLPQKLRLRVGDDFTHLPVDPREALAYFKSYERLDDQGDGIRSFVGIVVAMLVVQRSLFLIDEPEAFLHPPQSYRIGEFLADQTRGSKQVILATHSTDILRGILNRRRDITIIRIDRAGNTNTFRMLDPDRVRALVTDPLLSSARVLDGLFYTGAVVVEADSDARFYQIVSRNHRPDADLHFVNADNKQTVPKIMQIYREMGVRCAGIVDFDALNDRDEFNKQLMSLSLETEELEEAKKIQESIKKAAGDVSPDERLEDVKSKLQQINDRLSQLKGESQTDEPTCQVPSASDKEKTLRWLESRFHELIESTKTWKVFKKRGREALPPTLRPRFDRVSEICANNGLFINPCGQLESMLSQHGIEPTDDKKAWIVRALQLMPGLAVDESVEPFKFIKLIHEYLLNFTQTETPT